MAKINTYHFELLKAFVCFKKKGSPNLQLTVTDREEIIAEWNKISLHTINRIFSKKIITINFDYYTLEKLGQWTDVGFKWNEFTKKYTPPIQYTEPFHKLSSKNQKIISNDIESIFRNINSNTEEHQRAKSKNITPEEIVHLLKSGIDSGKTKVSSGVKKQSKTVLKDIITIEKFPDFLNRKIKNSITNENYKVAIEDLKRILSNYEAIQISSIYKVAITAYYISLCLNQMKKFTNIPYYLTRTIKILPDYIPALILKANAHCKKHEYDIAYDIIKKVLVKKPFALPALKVKLEILYNRFNDNSKKKNINELKKDLLVTYATYADLIEQGKGETWENIIKEEINVFSWPRYYYDQ